MATKNYNVLRDKVVSTPEGAAAVEAARREAVAEVVEFTLAELRKMKSLTQVEVAAALAQPQGAVSRIENTPDPLVSTVRRVVEAMGGRLELAAVFDDERIPLRLAPA